MNYKFVFSNENIGSCSKFNQTFLDVLSKHAPLKKKRFRANHASYVSKSMQKAIIRRSYLENVYFRKKNGQVFESIQKTKIIVAGFIKKNVKKSQINKLNPSFVNDNKLFWKTVKPFFSDKGSSGSNIKLMEKDKYCKMIKKLLKN